VSATAAVDPGAALSVRKRINASASVPAVARRLEREFRMAYSAFV
jgi:hypothetical protein